MRLAKVVSRRGRGWLMEKALRKCPGKVLMNAVERSCGERLGFKVPRKDACNFRNDVVADAVEFDRAVIVRKVRGITKGGAEAITVVDGSPV